MPDSPAPFDFGYPAAPGGNFPGILGDPGEELTPEGAGLGGGTAASGGQAFPVGCIFLSVLDTNPAVTLGYGTWLAYSEGRVLIGHDGSSYTAGDTGGSAISVTSHPFINQHNHYVSGTTGSANDSVLKTTGGQNAASLQHGHSYGDYSGYDSGVQLPNHDDISTLQPYLVVYIWVRTA